MAGKVHTPRYEPSPDWFRWAACRGLNPDMFFPVADHPGPGGMPPAAFAPAIAVCNDCTCLKACRQYALDNPSLDGIWGGTTTNERRTIRRRQARDRARSDGNNRRRSLRQLEPGDHRHGTLTGYNYWGCNCDLCVEAIQTHRNNKTG